MAAAGEAVGAAGRTLARNGVHLLVLWSFAVAQPLYDVLAKNAEFFAVRGSSSAEIVAFALVLLLAPVVVLLLVEAAAGAIGPGAVNAVHLALIGALAVLVVAQALKQYADLGGAPTIALSLGLGAAAAVLYARASLARTFLTVLVPAPFVFLGLFLLNSPVEQLVFPDAPPVRAAASVGDAMPVVLVVFDEFPVTSLMTADGDVDAARFPSFAALAADSLWFRNATTVDEKTTEAVPAILTGWRPGDERTLPVYADHPENLFTLLAGRYRMNVHESRTNLCPVQVCGEGDRARLSERLRGVFADAGIVYAHLIAPDDYEERLPPVSGAWGGFLDADDSGASSAVDAETGPGGKVKAFRAFVASVGRSRRPTLHFFHSMLPHGSWVYTPSCLRSTASRRSPGLLERRATFGPDEALVGESLRRLTLQVACADRLLGELLARLRTTGLYDRALLVVVADHGVSVRAGQPRRAVNADTTLEDIAYVPLFVRVPGRAPRVSDEHRQVVDILPTIADALGVALPRPVDGVSLLRDAPADRVVEVMTSRGLVEADAGELLARRDAAVRRLVGLLGSGDWAQTFYAAGPYPELLGRAVGDLDTVDGGDSVRLDRQPRELLADLPAEPATLPTPVTGTVRGAGAVPGRSLAFALNGRIEAVTTVVEHDPLIFFAHVPERAFHPGRNEVEIFWVNAAGDGLQLERLSGN